MSTNLINLWGVDTWASRYARRGLADRLKGTGIADPEMLYEPFETHNNWTRYTGGPGAIRGNVGVGARGGIMDLIADSAGASASAIIQWKQIGSSPSASRGQVGSVRDEPWYFALRFKLSSTDVESRTQQAALRNVAVTRLVWIGASGAASATKFAMGIDAATMTSVLSTVLLDTAWHNAEMWSRSAGTLYGSFDNEAPISLAIPTGMSGTWGLYIKNWYTGTLTKPGTLSLADALLIMGGAS